MSDSDIPLSPRKHKITIEYCVPCDYSGHALRAAEELVRDYQHVLDHLNFRMSSGGAFEVEVDGQVLFSKRELGRHPEPGEIRRRFEEFVGEGVEVYPRG